MKFNFWPFRTAQDDINELMDSIKEKAVVTPMEYPTMPTVETPRKKNEHYRIGWDSADEMVTLTLTPDGGFTTTLSMTPFECERMIRMLRATYESNETPTNEVH